MLNQMDAEPGPPLKKKVTGRVAVLPGPRLHVEQTAQHLLDAATDLESAADALTEGGEWVPF